MIELTIWIWLLIKVHLSLERFKDIIQQSETWTEDETEETTVQIAEIVDEIILK